MTPENKAADKIKNIRKSKVSSTKRIIEIIFVVLFILFITVMGILFFVMPKKEISQRENRKLTSFPEITFKNIWDGTFTNNLNLYYSDNFAFRDNLVDAKYAVSETKGLKVDDITIVGSEVTGDIVEVSGADKFLYDLTSVLEIKQNHFDDVLSSISFDKIPVNTTENENTSSSGNSNLSNLLNMDENELKGEQRGALYVVGDTALEIFYGSEAISKQYTDVLNEYAQELGAGVTLYNLIVPNHFEYGLPEKYKGKVGRDQKPFIDFIKDNLDENFIFIDIHSHMKEHYEMGEYLYFRSDHHWTSLGAYRAYEKFCEYANIKPVSLDTYEKRTTTGFLGSLYAGSMSSALAENPDLVEYYVSDLPYTQINTSMTGKTSKGKLYVDKKANGRTNGYLTFMGGDIPLATINTENKNGKKIIVFKESYGNAFVPFLVPHYEYIYVADIRYFPYNSVKFIKENEIGEVLFLNNIMAPNTPARVANIYMLKEQEGLST